MTPHSLKEYQKQIDDWFKEAKWEYWTPHEILSTLVEEVGEFSRLVNHLFGRKKKKETESAQELESEIGDILFTLSCFANANNIDLDKAIQSSIDKAQVRDKERFAKS